MVRLCIEIRFERLQKFGKITHASKCKGFCAIDKMSSLIQSCANVIHRNLILTLSTECHNCIIR